MLYFSKISRDSKMKWLHRTPSNLIWCRDKLSRKYYANQLIFTLVLQRCWNSSFLSRLKCKTFSLENSNSVSIYCDTALKPTLWSIRLGSTIHSPNQNCLLACILILSIRFSSLEDNTSNHSSRCIKTKIQQNRNRYRQTRPFKKNKLIIKPINKMNTWKIGKKTKRNWRKLQF